jgi:hypothetical protein
MKIIKNFLSKKQFKNIQSILMSSGFPYYYQNNYLDEKHNGNALEDYFFVHIIKDQIDSDIITDSPTLENILDPIMLKLKANNLVRAKINLYPNQHKHISSNFHMDQNNEQVKVALYCINTCNGWTEFKTGEKVPSIENSIILFKANEWHKGVTQTDTKRRINININYT